MNEYDGDRPYGTPFARDASEQPWMRASTPPWHMWGNTQVLTTQQTGGGGVASTPDVQQLIRCAYKRPESWHWVFVSKLLAMPTPGLPGSDATLDVHFDLTVGIGRSVVQIPDFEIHTWTIQNPSVPPIGDTLRTTTGRGVRVYNQNSVGTLTLTETIISEIVAQDIQLRARLILTTSGNGFTGSAEVSAYFSPKTHVRPDWLHPTGPLEQQFPGDEIGGR